MLFVIGGAYQGKLDYVKDRFSLKESDIFYCTEDKTPDFSKRCIYHYEKYVLYAMRNGEAPIYQFSDAQIVIMDDLNCGVVPIDPEIRAYREAVGRAGCAVTRCADEVVRIFCGLPKTLKKKTVKIYLIRHGMTQSAEDSCYCGSTDLPLTPRGIKALAMKKTLLPYPDVTGKKFYVSSRLRAKQTAEILFPGADHQENAAFDEMNFGDFELRKYEHDLEADPDFVRWMKENNEKNICPHGESSEQMKRRVLAEFKNVLSSREDSVIVCHGGPIAAIFSRYNPDCEQNYYQIVPDYGDGYCLEFDGDTMIKCTRLAE